MARDCFEEKYSHQSKDVLGRICRLDEALPRIYLIDSDID